MAKSKPVRPQIGAILLASGLSRRFGVEDKLLADFDGKPILQHAIDAIPSTCIDTLVVVANTANADAVHHFSMGAQAHITINEVPALGMGKSISVGMNAIRDLNDGLERVFIILGDMPRIAPETYTALCDAYTANSANQIIAPSYQGQRGHPVLFPKTSFEALAALDQDQGARSVISAHQGGVYLLPVNDPGVLADIDRPQDLQRLEHR